MGTLAYMSPEQAAGRWDLVGPASDVYSLGVTLYLVLTGKPAFQARHEGELLDKVREGDFSPPRQRKKDIPRALEAICLKAMARQPNERYATALEVAADLEHWLADEPLSAWREPGTVRARRWLGRHRTLATAVAAAALAATTALVLGLALLAAANDRERLARKSAQEKEQEAERQKHKSDANFKLARKAVDQYLRNVTQDERLQQHDLEGLRRDLLQAAANFYDEFVREASDDPEVLAEQGRAYQQLGRITQAIASKEKAITFYQQSLDVFERLTHTNPSDALYRRELARTHNSLAQLYDVTGQPDKAQTAIRWALEIRDELAGRHPQEPDYANELALSLGFLGVLSLERRQLEEGEAAFRRALEIGKQLVRTQPLNSDYKKSLALNHLNSGVLYWERARRPKESEEQLRQALVLWDELAMANPSVPDYQSRQGYVHHNLGELYRKTRRPEQAEASHLKALGIREKLAAEHPSVSDHRSKLARTCYGLGDLYQETGRPAEAEAAYRKGTELNERLAHDDPNVPGYAVDLGRGYGGLGDLLKERDSQAALDCFNEAIRTLEAVCQRDPQHADDAKFYLSRDYWGRCQLLTRLTRYALALQDWDRALELAPSLNRPALRLGRAGTLARMGAHAGAMAEVKAVLDKGQANGITFYNGACVYALCSAAVRQDEKLPSAEQGRLAEQYAVGAVDLLTKARAAGYFQPSARIKHMQNDSDLESLHGREDFKKLVRELEGKETSPDDPLCASKCRNNAVKTLLL